eukprot:Pgem_evm1s15374
MNHIAYVPLANLANDDFKHDVSFLDCDGTLLFYKNEEKKVIVRPYVKDFLMYLSIKGQKFILTTHAARGGGLLEKYMTQLIEACLPFKFQPMAFFYAE